MSQHGEHTGYVLTPQRIPLPADQRSSAIAAASGPIRHELKRVVADLYSVVGAIDEHHRRELAQLAQAGHDSMAEQRARFQAAEQRYTERIAELECENQRLEAELSNALAHLRYQQR